MYNGQAFTLKTYLSDVWLSRYFWWHLALADLRTKFRRSSLGILWAILNPLMLTILMTIVMSFVFKRSPGAYAPYVFSGLIIWDVVFSSAMMGCSTFINAEGYIKQYRHALIIYTIRNVTVAALHFCFGFIGLAVWILLTQPQNYGWVTLWVIPGLFLLILLSLPVATLCAIINTKFRDFSQLVGLIFQAIWYVSPIFIDAHTLLQSKKLYVLVEYNPVYHLLNLIRAPMLHGQAPTLVDFLYVFASIIILWLFAINSLIKNERNIIFYL